MNFDFTDLDPERQLRQQLNDDLIKAHETKSRHDYLTYRKNRLEAFHQIVMQAYAYEIFRPKDKGEGGRL